MRWASTIDRIPMGGTEEHRLQAVAQSRAATAEAVRAGGARNHAAIPLCSPFSAPTRLVPPTFLG